MATANIIITPVKTADILRDFWTLLDKIQEMTGGDTLWADEHTTAHEALCDLAQKYGPVVAEEFQKRLES